MSRIYFHSQSGTAELSGRERAYMGTFCSSLLLVSMRLDQSWPSEAPLYRRMLPTAHYTQAGDDVSFLRAFSTWLCVGGDRETFGLTTRVRPFDAALNTAVVVGGDAVKLMARLHGQCEVHAYVEGPNRSWLADIIESGRDGSILRSGQGWEAVVALLRSSDDEPIVTSYSVCNRFPNPQVANWTDDRDGDGFWDLPEPEQWTRALRGLRESGGGLEMKPDDWSAFYFGEGVSGFDVMEEATNVDAVDPHAGITTG